MESEILKGKLARLKDDPTPQSPAEDAEALSKREWCWADLGEGIGRILLDIPTIQPKNGIGEDVAKFRPSKHQESGNYDASYRALPHPRWPEPGAPTTDEIWCAYQAELGLRATANNSLREYCYWLTHEKPHLAALPPEKESDDLRKRADRALLQDAEQRAAENFAWLTGVWSARGIRVPSVEELEKLAASCVQVTNRETGEN